MAQQRNEVIQIESVNLNWWGKNNIILKNNWNLMRRYLIMLGVFI